MGTNLIQDSRFQGVWEIILNGVKIEVGSYRSSSDLRSFHFKYL